MDTGLLSCTDTDCLSAFYIADGIGLRIFQSDHGNRQIHLRLISHIFIFSHYIREEIFADIEFVSSLLKSNAEHFLVLQSCRHIIRIDLDYIIIAFFLLLQQFQRFRLISRSDHTVGYLSFDQTGRVHVTHIGQCDKIAEGRHSVCASGSCISACERRKISQIVHPVDLRKCISKGKSYRSSCR